MAKRPVPKFDFKPAGQAIKEARKAHGDSRKKASDEMFLSPRYLVNVENKGQHPSLQVFYDLSFRKNQKGQEWKLHEKCSYDFMRQSRGSSAAAG